MEGAMIFGVVLYAIVIIVCIASIWTLYEKAGKPGWASIIPIYNQMVMIEIAGKPWYWILLMFIPLVNIILGIWTLNLFVKSFGKSEGYTFGIIILPFIFLPLLAFSKDTKFVGLQPVNTVTV
ncbi:MAG TPA: DUF5684 domain-containing protein [Bacteroidia bacterium]|nr:DUF5684 domain-containing protein [Bacteroidia bacterium]